MSKQQWGHGYKKGLEDATELAFTPDNISYFTDEAVRCATLNLAMQMWHLLDAISVAAETGNPEARWALIAAAKAVLKQHYQWPLEPSADA